MLNYFAFARRFTSSSASVSPPLATLNSEAPISKLNLYVLNANCRSLIVTPLSVSCVRMLAERLYLHLSVLCVGKFHDEPLLLTVPQRRLLLYQQWSCATWPNALLFLCHYHWVTSLLVIPLFWFHVNPSFTFTNGYVTFVVVTIYTCWSYVLFLFLLCLVFYTISNTVGLYEQIWFAVDIIITIATVSWLLGT